MNHDDLSDRYAIVELLSRYFGAVDDDRLELGAAEGCFTPDGRYVRPNGEAVVGPEEILASQLASFARFRATHHVITDHVIDVAGDTARLRANLTAMHLWASGHGDANALESYFLAGGVLTAHAARTAHGWRLTELALRNVWRTGAGFGAMLQTGAR